MRRASLTNLVKTRKTYALAILILLACLVGGGVFYAVRYTSTHNGKNALFYKDKNIAFAIDGKNYYKTDVQKLIAYPLSRYTSKDTAAKEAFNALKAIKAAQNLGYTPSSSEVVPQKSLIYAALKLNPTQQAQYNNWFTLVATQSAINVSVNSPTPLSYAGYSYVFFFGQHLQSSPDYKPKDLNNPKLVAQDQAYAKQKASYYHQQLQDNKMSLNEALSKSAADMQLLGHNVGNPNFNASFTTGQSLSTAVYMQDIVHYISTSDKTGLSDVQTGKAPTAPIKSGGKSVNMYYYFVDLTAVPASKPVSSTQFNQALNKLTVAYRGFSS